MAILVANSILPFEKPLCTSVHFSNFSYATMISFPRNETNPALFKAQRPHTRIISLRGNIFLLTLPPLYIAVPIVTSGPKPNYEV